MSHAHVLLLLLASITLAGAFQAPPHSPLNAGHALYSKNRAPRTHILANQPALAAPAMKTAADFAPATKAAASFSSDCVQPVSLPAMTSLSPASLVGAAVVVGVVKLSHMLSASTPASLALFAHALAGTLGGLAALFSDTAVATSLGEQQRESFVHSMKFTAITKAVNSVTFAYISQIVKSMGSASILVAAAGTGVVATVVQSLFVEQGRKEFFRENVVRNVFVFQAFWLTYAGFCAVTPVFSISYSGIAIAGALSGIVSTAVASFHVSFEGGLRGAFHFKKELRKLRKSFKGQSRVAMQSGILFVVYQAVYTTVVHA